MDPRLIRDIPSLLDYLRATRDIEQLTGTLLTQWGPRDRRMMSADLLPPRRVMANQDTIEDVRYRTVAAVDGTRYSPAQLVDGGELWGKVHYELGNSDIMRQITGANWDAINRYLASNMGAQAAVAVVGFFNSMIIQALVEHDELANWSAIVFNEVIRRGDNAYYEYVGGPELTGHRVDASVDWTDATKDPWTEDIIPRIRFLTNLGYARNGIRVYTSEAVLQTLADHPTTANRLLIGPLATGQTAAESLGWVSESDVANILRRKLGVRSVETNEMRIMTKTGDERVYPEDHMTFIATTNRSEEVIYNEDDPADIRVVRGTIGFTGVGIPANSTRPGRRSALEAFLNQKDARIQMQGWQTTGPVILDPTAITDIASIDTGVVE